MTIAYPLIVEAAQRRSLDIRILDAVRLRRQTSRANIRYDRTPPCE
jgi:hypothetical protein